MSKCVIFLLKNEGNMIFSRVMIWALHGAVGRSTDWLDFSAAVREPFGEVRRLDLWRFLDCCPMPFEKIGGALADEILRIDDAPILVGYSMGGRLALHALLDRPDAWKAAVIISAHTGLDSEDEKVARRKSDAVWSALALKGEWLDFLTKWESQGVLRGNHQMPDRKVLKDRRASIARSFVDWSLGVQGNLLEKLDEIHCPTLWLTGERDEKFTQIAKAAVPKMPNAEQEIFKDCGHRIPWEQPEKFAQTCSDFLGRF